MKGMISFLIMRGLGSFLLLGLLYAPASAQFGQGIYEFGVLPQSWQMNPALSPDARLFVALPGVTARLHAPAFTLSDVLLPVNNSQSRLDFTSVFERQSGQSIDFAVAAQADLLQIGFSPNEKSYLGMGSSIVFQTDLQLPVDVLRLAQNGNTDAYFRDNNIDLSATGLSTIAYRQHHFAYSRTISEKWRVGGRIKYLQGMFALDSRDNKIILHATTDSIRLETNTLIQTAGLPTLLNDSGALSSNVVIESSDLIKFNRGTGLGYDFGLSFSPSERLNFSLSLTDFGSITWKQDVFAYSGGPKSYAFSGIEYSLSADSLTNMEEQLKSTADSLLNLLKFNKATARAFQTGLRTGFHLAASYKASPHLQFGGIFSTQRTQKEVRTAFSSYIQWNPGRLMQLRTSYTFAEGSGAHLGGGFCLNLGPIQWYLISDNWSLLFLPERSTLVHAQTGINLLFGSGKSRD